jgi:SMC interacting uncharacterized protein involved in chromosome segregation
MEVREDLKTLLDKLATQRDELLVQMSLAKLEAREEWERLEKEWSQIRSKLVRAAEVGGDTARELVAAAKLAGEELRRGYERLRNSL